MKSVETHKRKDTGENKYDVTFCGSTFLLTETEYQEFLREAGDLIFIDKIKSVSLSSKATPTRNVK